MQPETTNSPVSFSEIPDFYLHVAQDNEGKTLMIDDVNEGFSDLLATRPDHLIGTDLRDWFAKGTIDELDELEFTSDTPDLFEILSKLRTVKWKLETGSEVSFPLKISRIDASSTAARFKLSVPNERNARAKAQLSAFLQAHFEGHVVLDEPTGLANRQSCLSFYDSLVHFVNAHDIPVAFATIRIDRFDKSIALYGEKACLQLIQHVARGCQRALAPEDVVARLNDQQIALFMFNVSRESARVILNRLRWLIRSHRIVFGGKSDFSVTVSFAFNMLSDEAHNVAEQCETALVELSEDERNRLIELAA